MIQSQTVKFIVCGTCNTTVEKKRIEEHLKSYHMWG